MLAVFLTAVSTLFSEIGDLIGKAEVARGRQTNLAMGFFGNFWIVVIFLTIVLVKGHFGFTLASLPTFTIRAFLEILQSHFTMKAIIRADRSTYGFVRTLTLPLLLGVDFLLGYAVSLRQVSGMFIIIAVMLVVFLSRKLDKQGLGLVLFTALNAVATISLLKYDITHFNAVEAEQLVIAIILLIYFWIAEFYINGGNALVQLFSGRLPLFQSIASAFGGVVESFAYNFAPASIIVAAKRSTATGWSVASGRLVFAERHFAFKIIVLAALIAGIILLIP